MIKIEELMDGNMIIPYEIRVSPRAKRINITIAKGQVKVAVPHGVTVEEAKGFVELKKEWIVNHVQAYQRYLDQQPKKKYVVGEKFHYQGKSYILRIEAINCRNIMVELKADSIWVYIPENLPPQILSIKVKEGLIKWYRSQAKKVFKEKLDNYARLMDLEYNELRVKEQKTRWGSCSSKGNINLNWKVIMAPSEVIDYLIVHELAHLLYMNHSQDFWKLVASVLPDYEFWKKWLKENGRTLYI